MPQLDSLGDRPHFAWWLGGAKGENGHFLDEARSWRCVIVLSGVNLADFVSHIERVRIVIIL